MTTQELARIVSAHLDDSDKDQIDGITALDLLARDIASNLDTGDGAEFLKLCGLTELEEKNWLLDPEVCPSSLGEDDKPMDESSTAHIWDETTNPVTCAECGTNKD